MLPKCKACGNNFTEKSREEYRAAPSWKDDCPACTKKKFEKYLGEYLLPLARPEGVVALAKKYFGDDPVAVHEADSDERIVGALTGLVYGRQPAHGDTAPATVGEAIASFVRFSDDEIKEHTRPDKKTRLYIALLITGASSIIVAAVLLYMFG